MSLHNDIKLKQLYDLLPEGVVAPATWFTKHHYSRQLLYKYAQNGWLTKIGQGLFIRDINGIKWQGVVLGLQKLANLPFHIGGITALNLQGFAHYLPLGGEQQIFLYGTSNPPQWIKNLTKAEQLYFLKKPSFGSSYLKTLPTATRDWSLSISTPERALLEMLYLVEKEGITFEFVAEIFQGLTTLRPNVLNELLLECNNIRIRRLFLFLATYFNHAWFKYIKVDEIYIGKGRMQIVKNGVFEKNYLITVPKEYSAK